MIKLFFFPSAFLPERDSIPANETEWQKIDDLFKSLGNNRKNIVHVSVNRF